MIATLPPSPAGEITHNDARVKINEIIDVVNDGVVIIDSLRLISTMATQEPTALDTAITVNFNPVNATSAGGSISYNATSNKLTLNKGLYSKDMLISYGRDGNTGESHLYFVGRIGAAGVEVENDNSIFSRIDNVRTTIPAAFSLTFQVDTDGTEVDFIFWRDSGNGGDNSGGLFQNIPARAGASTSASASIKINKIG